MYLSTLQFNDLIPMESKNLDIRKNTKRVIIGHNVGFDRSFIKEQYYLEVILKEKILDNFNKLIDFSSKRKAV